MQIGQTASVKRVISQEDFDRFAALSGDDNPIHVDPEFSARTKFGRTVAHGMFLYSTVCAALGTRLPGPGTLQMEQELMFSSPTFTGEEVEIQLEVTQVQPDEGLADLTTVVVRPGGEIGLQGRTLVRLPGGESCWGSTRQRGVRPTYPVTSPSFKGLQIGQRAETQRIFSTQDLAEYGDLTGDANPLFSDSDYTRQRGLIGSIVPGALLGGLFSCLLGTQLPGQGTNYLKQKLQFLAPAFADQELMASVEIVRLRPEKQLVNLCTLCTNPAGETVCDGEALVWVSDVKTI
jgi:acyl dehydratase